MGLDFAEPLSAFDAATAPILHIADAPLPGGLGDYEVVRVAGPSAAVRALLERRFACVILDCDLDALVEVRTAALDVPVILRMAGDDEALAVQAVRQGAQDVLFKSNGDLTALRRAVALAVERKRVEALLTHRALHDHLTGLPNRALFLDRLGQALSRLGRHATSLAVLFLDLDRFKAVNDVLGHAAGDELLRAVGARLHDVLRVGDTAARLGGDEFAVLCEDIAGERHAVGVAERVAEALRQPFRLGGGDEVNVGTSVGIALAREGTEHPEALLREADAAMYRAKERGGNLHEVYDDGMRERTTRRRETEVALRRALARGELAVRFLPQVDLETHAVCGAEALLRWNDPERGLVGPLDFIETAEETGLILPMGAWVLEEACRLARRWPRLITAVNLSARQSMHPEIVDVVAGALERTGVDPSLLLLEIPEGAVSEDLEVAAATLRRLEALGVRLALDDFGTGASSLRALQRLPVDEVKVDGSLVAHLEDDPQAEAMVRAVISLAHALGLRAVAEGVETAGQAERLRGLGCDLAQGFFFHRPVDADTLAALVRAGT